MDDRFVIPMKQRQTAWAFVAYMELLRVAWDQETPVGTLPDDNATLAAYAKVSLRDWLKHIRPHVEKCFQIEHGRWHQKRMELVFQEVEQAREKNGDRARTAANARWHKPEQCTSNAQALPKHSTSNAQAMPVKVKDIVSSTIERTPVQENDDDPIAHGALEVRWPTLPEILAWCQMDGIPEDQGKRFFNHFDGLGWMNGKTPIINPRSFLQNWRNPHPKASSTGTDRKKTPAAQMFEWKQESEAVKALIAQHPANPDSSHAKPTDLLTTEEREDFRAKKRRLSELTRLMAGGKQ